MIWMDFSIEQAGSKWTVKGDWPGEVMGWDRDGNKEAGLKSRPLYQPGDVFVVDEDGWLNKVEDNK